MDGHNRLPEIAANVSQLHGEIEGHLYQASQKALMAGEALAEAKRLVAHGQWSKWLSGTGVGERMAQRYMRLHRLGINSDTVSDLGGISAALKWASELRLPKKGEILIASADDCDPDGDGPLGFVWLDGHAFHVAAMDIRPECPRIEKTRKPISVLLDVGERAAWLSLWAALDMQLTDLSFVVAPETLAAIELREQLVEITRGGAA